MKMFDKNIEEVLEYLKLPLVNNENELELIFGATPYKNPIDKGVFMRVLDECRNTYEKSSEIIDLDITTEFRGKPGNVRASIHGIDDIKKYCKDGNLKDIGSVDYMQKRFLKDKPGVKDEDYNVRLKVKTENMLDSSHYFVKSFNENYEDKGKHYRYKKRFSFLTGDKLFRIDLTILKSTKYFKGKYDFKKSFKKANILSNAETYEVEIEYVGWEKRGTSGISAIDELYKNYMDGNEVYYPTMRKGNIYDPLNLGINTELFEGSGDVTDEDDQYEYGDSPRYDGDENPRLFMNFSDSSKKYSYDEYRSLIGKSTMIKKEYFIENSIDMKVFNTLMEYSKRNIFHAVISDISEEIDEKTNKFIKATSKVSLYPPIGNTRYLDVPLEYLVGGYFSITEDKITTLGEKPKPYEVDDPVNTLVNDKVSQGDSNVDWGGLGEGLNKDKNTETKLLTKLFETLEETVNHLSLIIYDTTELLSFKLKEDIIFEYRKLTKQKAKYFTFVGPQPVTLNKEGLDINNPGSILVDFAVTEKADGERYELFIINGSGYFINSKKEVIDSGCSFGNIEGKWILDGEYITKDKFNEPIRLFMIFDVYWCDIKGSGIPIEAHTLPFITRNPDDNRSRKYILDRFMEKVEMTSKKILPKWGPSSGGECPTEIRLKTYEFGYQSSSIDEKMDAKNIGKDKYIQIFKSSRLILKKDKEGHFPYRIDGLIYLPTRLSIRGSVENVNSIKVSGTWDYNYKWKESKENTIDFQVKVKTDINKGEIKEIIQNYVNKDANGGIGKRMVEEYKTLELYVGYKEIDDKNIKYCMKVMDTFERSKTTIQKFNLHSDEDEKYNETNIPLVNGKMLCDNFEKSEIRDGDLVEMRFNPLAENGMIWEPIRVRKDKLKPQYFLPANNIWKTIKDPITEDMITGGKIIKGDISIVDSGEYYINRSDDLLIDSFPLRRFHNYIKSRLISGVCSSVKGRLKVMDLSIGRGGDIQKYLESQNVSFLFGIDISSNVNEACRRFYTINNKDCKPVIVRGNTSKNIKNLEYSDVKESTKEDKEHCEIMTNIVYGKEAPIPKKYMEIRNKYFGIASDGFDIISSQFSMHYYFESNRTFEGFIRNLKENVKKGGYFIGTCYDGQKIFDHFKKLELTHKREEEEISEDISSEESSEDESVGEETSTPTAKDGADKVVFKDINGNVVYKIEKKYQIDNFDYIAGDEGRMFGQVIDVYMDSIGQTIPEYLVNFEYFVKVMNDNGFKPVVPTSVNRKFSSIFKKDNFNNQNIGEFKKIINKIPEIDKTDQDFSGKYSPAKDMYTSYSVNPMEVLSSFNNYFVFKKME
tara:strand:- start:5910 stop:9881 length:3972 start_codon:yes stop_codon:yes gene_type:complete